MKKPVSLAAFLVAFPISSVIAADLPTKKEPIVAPIAAPTWTGGYVGLNAGGTFGNNSSVNATTWNTYLPASNADLALAADSDEAGHLFQYEAGRLFQYEAGHCFRFDAGHWLRASGS
jgi:opacity protein-like surface antigen